MSHIDYPLTLFPHNDKPFYSQSDDYKLTARRLCVSSGQCGEFGRVSCICTAQAQTVAPQAESVPGTVHYTTVQHSAVLFSLDLHVVFLHGNIHFVLCVLMFDLSFYI